MIPTNQPATRRREGEQDKGPNDQAKLASPSRKPRKRYYALLCAGLVVSTITTWGIITYKRNPKAEADRARFAIGDRDQQALERSAARLEKWGYPDHVRMVRGEWHLSTARQVIEEIESRHRQHTVIWQAENLLALAGHLSAAPSELQLFQLGLLTNYRLLTFLPSFQNLIQLQTRARVQLELSFKEFSSIPWESPLFPEVAGPAAEALLKLREGGAIVPLEGPFKLLHFAVDKRPNDVEAHRLLAVVCMDLNSADEAIHELREVGRLDPADGRPYRQIGLLLRNQRQHGPAMEAYQEALRRRLKPQVVAEVVEELAEEQTNNGLGREALATLGRCPGPFQKRPELLALRAAAQWQVDAQHYRADVIQLLAEALAAAPDHVAALRLRARVHVAEEEMILARPLLLRALQRSPHDHESRHLLAQILTSLGEHKEAAEQRRLGDISQRLKRELDDLARRAGAEPLADEPRLRAARICLELGELPSAQQWLRAVLGCNPSNREARKLLDELATGQRPRS